MKQIFLMAITICLILIGNFEAVSQTRTAPKKIVKTTTTKKPATKSTNISINNGTGTGLGSGVGAANGTGIGQANGTGIGRGTGNGVSGVGNQRRTIVSNSRTRDVRIISKPKAEYTEEARNNIVQGTVVLKITFLATGEIGDISPVSGLSGGLTEQAINAAKSIKFEPAQKDGAPYTVTRNIEYSFVLN